jgi:hypothetical protein
MAIDLEDLLDAGCLEKGGGYAFFYTENYTLGSGDLERDEKGSRGVEKSTYSYGCRTEFDGFERVFDLKKAAFW